MKNRKLLTLNIYGMVVPLYIYKNYIHILLHTSHIHMGDIWHVVDKKYHVVTEICIQ